MVNGPLETLVTDLSKLSAPKRKELVRIGLKLANVPPKPSNVVPFQKKAKAKSKA